MSKCPSCGKKTAVSAQCTACEARDMGVHPVTVELTFMTDASEADLKAMALTPQAMNGIRRAIEHYGIKATFLGPYTPGLDDVGPDRP